MKDRKELGALMHTVSGYLIGFAFPVSSNPSSFVLAIITCWAWVGVHFMMQLV